MEFAVLVFVIVAPAAIILAPIIWPSMVSEWAVNSDGQWGILDRGCLKVGAAVGVLLFLLSALRQGDASPWVYVLALGLGLVLALLMGVYGHIIYRRQQSLRRRSRLIL